MDYNLSTTKSMLSDSTYDFLKKLVLIVLPAFATLYFSLGAIWGLPYVEQVMGTTAALSTFLGVLLRLSARSYNDSDLIFDGVVNVTATLDGSKRYSLDLNEGNAAHLDSKVAVIFKVNPHVQVETRPPDSEEG
jgi:hypothetical protein